MRQQVQISTRHNLAFWDRDSARCATQQLAASHSSDFGTIRVAERRILPVSERLLLGTTNPGKLAEMRALFAGATLPLTDLQAQGIDVVAAEEEPDYAANAVAKAVHYAKAAGLWTLADDTGLEVDALDGAPGLHSARVAGDDAARRRLLLDRLAGRPRPWTARFRCAVALASPDGRTAVGFGLCTGEILPEARGSHGFGYDPLFLVEDTGRTMAELEVEQKNRVSHRARAAFDLLRKLRAGELPGAPL
jgi:XTP/dITP diphosphohydrolase